MAPIAAATVTYRPAARHRRRSETRGFAADLGDDREKNNLKNPMAAKRMTPLIQ